MKFHQKFRKGPEDPNEKDPEFDVVIHYGLNDLKFDKINTGKGGK